METNTELNVAGVVRKELGAILARLEKCLGHDALSITGEIRPGLERKVRTAIELTKNRGSRLSIILTTPGGIVEIVERMVDVIRHHYAEVSFIVPDYAMSAGTVFVMSGDQILMDYASCLGPIDAWVEKDGRLASVHSYLLQYERLRELAVVGRLTSADMVLLNKLDLADLHQYEQAMALSVTLLKGWLARYKFKDWTKTATRGLTVTPNMKTERAKAIARDLNNTEKWHSHGRSINMRVLNEEVGLQVDDFRKNQALASLVDEYFGLLKDAVRDMGLHFVHSRGYI